MAWQGATLFYATVGRTEQPSFAKVDPEEVGEGSRPKAEGSAWGNGPSLRAEHRAIVRAPRSKRGNIGEISEYSKEEAEIGTLALGGNPYFRKRTNPEWPSARRGEGSRREGERERELRGK